MSGHWIVWVAFAAASISVISIASLANDLYFRYRGQLRERVNGMAQPSRSEATQLLFRDLKQLSRLASSERRPLLVHLRGAIEQAGMQVDPLTLSAIGGFAGLVTMLAIAALLRRPYLAPLGIIPGVLAAWSFVFFKRRRRVQKLVLQLPDVFDVMGRAVRAGQTIPTAMQIVADDFQPPVSEDFQQCYEQQQLGMPYDAVLRKLAQRTGIMELRILVVGLIVQAQSGGNVVELLSNLSELVRKRIKMQQRVKALTGEGRMQAAVLIVLPVLAFCSMWVLSPEYAAVLLDRPWLLALTCSAQVLGTVWMRQIVNIDY